MGTNAIAGATGLVGSRLVSKLTSSGNTVRVLTRNIGNAKRRLPYGKTDFFGTQQLADALKGADAVVNLAGTQKLVQVRQEALRRFTMITLTLLC